MWLMSYPERFMVNGGRITNSGLTTQLARNNLRSLPDQVPEVGDAFYGTVTIQPLYRSSVQQVLSAEQRDPLRAWIHFLDRPAMTTDFVFSSTCPIAAKSRQLFERLLNGSKDTNQLYLCWSQMCGDWPPCFLGCPVQELPFECLRCGQFYL